MPEATTISDVMTLEEAAAWLRVQKKTLQNWIYQGRFTVYDGLRQFGESRIHFPTMRARVVAGTLMTGQSENQNAELREFLTVPEAADFLRCAKTTLEGWITRGRFTKHDGLCAVGDLNRIHLPTLRQRVLDDALMSGASVTAQMPSRVQRARKPKQPAAPTTETVFDFSEITADGAEREPTFVR